MLVVNPDTLAYSGSPDLLTPMPESTTRLSTSTRDLMSFEDVDEMPVDDTATKFGSLETEAATVAVVDTCHVSLQARLGQQTSPPAFDARHTPEAFTASRSSLDAYNTCKPQPELSMSHQPPARCNVLEYDSISDIDIYGKNGTASREGGHSPDECSMQPASAMLEHGQTGIEETLKYWTRVREKANQVIAQLMKAEEAAESIQSGN